MSSRTIAPACVLAVALALSPSAHAQGGGGGGGGGGAARACTPLVTDTPSQVVNRKARVNLKFRLSGCTAADQVIATSVTTTVDTVTADGATSTCVGTAWDAGTLTVRTRDVRGLVTTVPSSPACGLGVTGAVFHFVATATDSATGTVIGTATATLRVTLAF